MSSPSLTRAGSARIPKSLFGDGDPAGWSYAVAVMSQEGFRSSSVRRIRDVEMSGQQRRIGGGDGSINTTRIMDLLALDAGTQETVLSAFTSVSIGSVDALTAVASTHVTRIGNG